MNRRGFLRLLGTFAAASTLPSFDVAAKMVESPRFNLNTFALFETAPLAPGGYTITWGAGDYGLCVGGIQAKGGETLVKVWTDSTVIEKPALKLGGIYVDYREHYDFTDPEVVDRMIRGERITKL